MMRTVPRKLITTARRPCHARVFSSAVTDAQTEIPPTLTASPRKDLSLMQRIFNPTSMPSVSLDRRFPGLPALKDPIPVSSDVTITTANGGVRVASCVRNAATSHIGVFIDVGSRWESPDVNGISHFMELMAYKSTSRRSEFRLVREMNKIGANINVHSSREHMFYCGEVLQQYAPEMLGTFADVLQRNLWNAEEADQARELYLELNQERATNPEVMILEGLHSAAYGDGGLGQSLYGPDNIVKQLTPAKLQAWRDAYYTHPRMVVSGVGIDHNYLVQLTDELFSDSEPRLAGFNTRESVSSSPYVGGEVRMLGPVNDGLVHFAAAFETANWHDKDVVPMCVLEMMMGGGGAFSAGGPGKGMYSRLYRNVLSRHGFIDRANAFNAIYSDTSLFGVYGTAEPPMAEKLVGVIADEMHKMTGPVDQDELSRAKNGLKSNVHIMMESNANRMEDIGRQVLTFGKVQTPEETCALVDAVSAEDIQRVAEKMLGTVPSFVVLGGSHRVPKYAELERMFRR